MKVPFSTVCDGELLDFDPLLDAEWWQGEKAVDLAGPVARVQALDARWARQLHRRPYRGWHRGIPGTTVGEREQHGQGDDRRGMLPVSVRVEA